MPDEHLVVVELEDNTWYLGDIGQCPCCVPPVSGIFPSLSALCASEPRATVAFMRGAWDVN